ncbi:MAG: glutaredoxin family protein [Nitrospirota bacterium]
MVRITFYYKAGCWLCDTVEETLNGLAERHGLRIRKVDIESDPELYELYRFDIPVLEFGDGSTLNGRIRKKDLLRKFKKNRERPDQP